MGWGGWGGSQEAGGPAELDLGLQPLGGRVKGLPGTYPGRLLDAGVIASLCLSLPTLPRHPDRDRETRDHLVPDTEVRRGWPGPSSSPSWCAVFQSSGKPPQSHSYAQGSGADNAKFRLRSEK